MLERIQATGLMPVSNNMKASSTPVGQQNFSELLKTTIDNVNNSQMDADKVTQKLISGDQIDLHNVMITSQKALITLQTTVEVRNKIIEAYQEVMRMQV